MTVGELFDVFKELLSMDEAEDSATDVFQARKINGDRLLLRSKVLSVELFDNFKVAKPSAVAAVEKTDEWGDVVDKLHSARDEIVLLRHKLYELQKMANEAARALDKSQISSGERATSILRRMLIVIGE